MSIKFFIDESVITNFELDYRPLANTTSSLNKLPIINNCALDYRPLVKPVDNFIFSLFKSNNELDMLMNPDSTFNGDLEVFMDNSLNQIKYVPLVHLNLMNAFVVPNHNIDVMNINSHDTFVNNTVDLKSHIHNLLSKGVLRGVDYFYYLRDYIESIKFGCDNQTHTDMSVISAKVVKNIEEINSMDKNTVGDLARQYDRIRCLVNLIDQATTNAVRSAS